MSHARPPRHPARRRPDQGRPRPRPAQRASTSRLDVRITNGDDRRDRRRPAATTARSSTAPASHLFPGFVDPHVHLRVPGPGAQGGPRDRHALRGRRRLRRRRGDAEHEPDRRLRARSCARLREAARREARIPVGFLASVTTGLHGEALTEMAELRECRRARLHRRRQARPPRRAAAQGAAVPEARAAGSSPCTRRTRRSPARASMHEGEVSARLGLAGIPSISESTLIARDAAIARYEDGRIHIQHLSARESVEAVAEAKARGVQITCEASPHHLTLTDEALLEKLDTRLKMNPPLRSEDDRQALIDGPARTARSTASPPTTRRTRARRRRCRSRRRRWARPAWRPRSPRSTRPTRRPAARADRREAERGRGADGPADAGDRGRQARRPGADRPRRASGRSARPGYESAPENCCFAGRTLKRQGRHHDRRRRHRLPRSGVLDAPYERLRPARGRHALRRRGRRSGAAPSPARSSSRPACRATRSR